MKFFRFSLIAAVIIAAFTGCGGPSRYEMVQNHLTEKNLDAAESTCREILSENPNDGRAYYYLGLIFYNRDDISGAIDNFENSIRLNPSPQAYIALAKIHFERQRLNTALAYLDTVSILGDNSEMSLSFLEEVLGTKSVSDAMFKLGMRFYEVDHFKIASEKFEHALIINAENREAKYHLHMSKGLFLYNQKGIDAYWDAIVEFGEASVIKPERGEPHYLMGVCYEKKDADDFDTPIKEYRQALELELTPFYKDKAVLRLKKLEVRKKKLDAFWGRDK